MTGSLASDWLSYHLFYHADRNRVLTGFVRPALHALWAGRRIETFFFIRYSLGGPHIRLRLRPCSGQTDAVAEELREAAAKFVRECPSSAPLPLEEILRVNRSILGPDAKECDGEAYPDNTFSPFPFQLEVERYGGPGLLEASLDFFALSSLQALRFVSDLGDTPPSRRLTCYFRLLARQALGLAATADELLDLLDYGVRYWPPLESIASHGDRIFDQRPDDFRRLLQAEIGLLASPFAAAQPSDSKAADLEAARRLSEEIARTEPAVRRRIATSQMHMTANRLGLTNPEEVYVSRLLWRTAEGLAEADPVLWNLLLDRLAAPVSPPRAFRDILHHAFKGLFGTDPKEEIHHA